MRVNPVLRNESRLTVRTPRFTIMLLIYIAILSAGTLLFYNTYSNEIYASGLNMQGSIMLYIGMAIAQAVLLMFIVPSLTATSICSEREKQTLDILLSTRLSPFQIIIGKLLSSSLKVIMLIVCTIPLYAVCALIGGVKISNILVLILSFIINTIFVGSIGVFVSTYVKTSKVATALTYAIVLFLFVGTIVIAYVIWMITMMRLRGGPITTPPTVLPIIYLSPAVGFVSMLSNQVGLGNDLLYMLTEVGISKYAEYISIGIQGILTFIFLYLAARRLNPLNRKRNKKVKIKTKNKVKE